MSGSARSHARYGLTMAVHLTRIYTRTGDDGTTGLSDFSRVSKNDPRLEAYADCDEANAAIGVAVALGRTRRADSRRAAADPERPVRRRRRPVDARWSRTRSTRRCASRQAYIDRLEAWCDEFNEPLPALNSFILPGGTALSALLHVARTVARRAERSAWRAVDAPRRIGQRAAGEVPQPAVGPAVHPVAGWRTRTATCCGSRAAAKTSVALAAGAPRGDGRDSSHDVNAVNAPRSSAIS